MQEDSIPKMTYTYSPRGNEDTGRPITDGDINLTSEPGIGLQST
jgi:hypothetical protein